VRCHADSLDRSDGGKMSSRPGRKKRWSSTFSDGGPFSKYPLSRSLIRRGDGLATTDLVRDMAGQLPCQVGGGIRSLKRPGRARLGARRSSWIVTDSKPRSIRIAKEWPTSLVRKSWSSLGLARRPRCHQGMAEITRSPRWKDAHSRIILYAFLIHISHGRIAAGNSA